MAEAFAEGMKVVAECRCLEGVASRYQRRCERLQADLEPREVAKKGLRCQLERVAAEMVQAKEQGYQQGRSDIILYLRKVMLTLAGKFSDDQ